MLAILSRLNELAGRELQRLGLSATVGNPDELLDWLAGASTQHRRVIAPTSQNSEEADVQLDWVGSLANAAAVVSRLHNGENRLVFVDSRARAEQLTAALRAHDTEAFLSHGSLGRDERRRTEEAFAQANNCVIVGTSTLELGIDIGDLDRVIQIDAPSSVSSFLQRLGRSGRRAQKARNSLFLATSDAAFLQSLGLIALWDRGFVEPVVPPPFPTHLFAQQVMALTLQESSLGVRDWSRWLGRPFVFGSAVEAETEVILRHMLSNGILFEDQGLLAFGEEGEATFGRRHFMDLMSAFTSEPVFVVRAGRTDIGLVPDIALSTADANSGLLLLAGRHWLIEAVDWKRRVIRARREFDLSFHVGRMV